MIYLWLKVIHVISSTLLFGTGLGSAFYFYQANRSKNLPAIVFAARNVVLADWLFTTPAVIIQPITGFWMMHLAGFPWSTSWIIISLALYIVTGACWLPVVWLQIQMHKMANNALINKLQLTQTYYFYYRWWFWLGWPAFIAVIIIFILMTFKP